MYFFFGNVSTIHVHIMMYLLSTMCLALAVIIIVIIRDSMMLYGKYFYESKLFLEYLDH